MITNAEKFLEKFESDFQAYLTPENTFYLNTKGTTGNNLSVHVPQYLTTIAGPSNPSATALDVAMWNEDNKTITQQRFRTIAYQVDDYKEFFTSQSMRQDAMDAIKMYLDTAVGNYAAYMMASTKSATQLKTTGTATRYSSVIGSTATVKRISETDMLKVKTLIGKSQMQGNWYAVLNPDQIEDLMTIANFTTADKLGIQSRLVSGQFADILGIKIFQRQGILGANVAYGTATPDIDELKNIYAVPGATVDTVSTTDVGAAIFWNENALYANRGLTKIYAEPGKAIYQGDLISAQYTFGIDKIRKDEVGVISLIEAIA